MSEQKTILVQTADTTTTRRRGHKELEVQILADNVNLFLTQIESVLDKTPEEVSKFKLNKFTVSAEISGNGKLVLIGSGVEVTAKGGLTFEFERKA